MPNIKATWGGVYTSEMKYAGSIKCFCYNRFGGSRTWNEASHIYSLSKISNFNVKLEIKFWVVFVMILNQPINGF